MAVTFRSASGSQSSTAALTASVTQPTGSLPGDLVFVALNIKNSTSDTFSAVSGWTLSSQDANAFNGTSQFKTAVYYRVLDGTESWPISFSWTATTAKFAWNAIAFTPGTGNVIVIDGEAAVLVSTSGSSTATANARTAVASNVCSLIINCGRTSAASATAISVTPPTNWTEPSNADQSTASGTTAALSQLGVETCYRTGQSGTVTPGVTTWSQSTVAANIYHFLLADPPKPYSGGPQGWSSPAGIRAVYVRPGVAMASLIPPVVSSSPVILTTSLPEGTTGQPYTATLAASGGTLPYTWSISSGSLPGWATLNTSTGAITGTVTGPPAVTSFTVKVTDARSNTATQPLSITTTAGPVIPSGPVRTRITPPPRGRTWSNPGGPVRNPVVPAPVYPLHRPVQAKLLPPPRRGRMAAAWGIILFQNPNAGPVFTQATAPARARITPPPRGRIASNRGVRVAVPQPAKIYPLQGPVRARIATPFSKGRVSSSRGAPLRNPGSGPVFRQAVHPARAVIPQVFSKGRTGSNPGGPVPPPLVKPPFRPQGTVQAKLPLPRRGTCRAIRFLPVAGNPQQGPAFRQATQPARIRPSLPPRGRIGSNPGVAVFIPPVPAGPVFVPSHQALRARLPQQPFLRGRASSNAGAPLRNPGTGPVFRQRVSLPLVQPLPRRGTCRAIRFYSLITPPVPPVTPPVPLTAPVRAHPLPVPKGRASGSKGAPVQNPQAGPVFRPPGQPAGLRVIYQRIGAGQATPLTAIPSPVTLVVFPQATAPVRIRASLPSRGRVYSHPGAPARNPQAGPRFTSATSPARARITPPPRGRTGSNPGGPVPPPPIVAIFRQAASPARARIPQNGPRGRVYSRLGAPLRNPEAGPAFRQAVHPVQARQPLPPRGRIVSNPGGPVRNPVVPAPVYPLHSPVQARFPLPARGRTKGNPGTPPPPPPVPAKVYPAQGPVRIRITPPPRGRTTGNPGGPVRNPHQGPVFRQAVKPIRGIIPQNAPRGRAAGNPGGPVENIPFATLRFRTGTPYFQWDTEDPGFQWDTSSPGFQWATGDPEAG